VLQKMRAATSCRSGSARSRARSWSRRTMTQGVPRCGSSRHPLGWHRVPYAE
jgi:hypothetical protein